MNKSCIDCHFLAKVNANDVTEVIAFEDVSLSIRQHYENKVSFRQLPRYFACYRHQWSDTLDFTKGIDRHQLIEVVPEYSEGPQYDFICNDDKVQWGCFAEFEVGKSFKAVEDEIELQQAKRQRIEEFGLTAEQINIDRRLLRVTVITLIISTLISLLSLLANLYQLIQPIDIRGPIAIQIVPISVTTPPFQTETAVPEILPTDEVEIKPEATHSLNN